MAIWPFSKADQVKHNIRTTTIFTPGKHNGVDKAPADQSSGIALLASQSGKLQTGIESNGGKWTYILGKDGRGYGNDHCASFIKTEGYVEIGEPIAIMGSTGHSTGIHTHFWIRANYNDNDSFIDPEKQNLTYIDEVQSMTFKPTLYFIAHHELDLFASPTMDSKRLVHVGQGTQLSALQGTDGQEVVAWGNTSKSWYFNGQGWYSATYVDIFSSDNAALQKQIADLEKQLTSFKPISNAYIKS